MFYLSLRKEKRRGAYAHKSDDQRTVAATTDCAKSQRKEASTHTHTHTRISANISPGHAYYRVSSHGTQFL